MGNIWVLARAKYSGKTMRNNDRSLARVLGTTDCALLVVGAIIGSGIFLTPGNIARLVGNFETVFLVWIFGGVLTFCGAVSYAELGASYPEAGGIYVFLGRAYGPLLAFLYGWCVFLVIVPGSIATLANAFAIYLQFLIGGPPGIAKATAVLLILLLVVMNSRGIRVGATVQNILTVAKVAALIGIIGALFLSPEQGVASRPATFDFEFPALGAIGLAMIAVLWSYDGWHLVTFTAGEVKNPQKSLTRGLLFGIAAVITLYLVVNLAYLQMLSVSEMANTSRVAGVAMERAVGPIGSGLVAGAILISIAGAMNGNVLAGPRVPFAMAEDRLFFSRLTYVHPKYKVPTVAIFATGLLAVVLTWIGTFEQLFNYVIFVGWIFYGLGALAVIRLRWKHPEAERPYRAWGYPFTPLFFAVSAAVIVLNSLLNNFSNSVWGLVVIVVGLPVFVYWRFFRS